VEAGQLKGTAREELVSLISSTTSWDRGVRDLLRYLGEDPDRDGLRETPRRIREAWQEWFSGYSIDIGRLFKTFEHESSQNDLVSVTDIPLYSQCEHHLLPFFGSAHIGYIPSGRVLGLSKLARVVRAFASRLQMQERLTAMIADAIQENLTPKGVAVSLTCRHLCMEARGVRTPGTLTTTYAFRGCLVDQQSAQRADFLAGIPRRSGAEFGR